MTRRFCDGLARRDMLRIGAAGMLGSQLSLQQLLAAENAKAKSSTGKNTAAKATSFIYIILQGGLSTIDTWDMKPDAPSEFAGEFQPVDTNVPGIQV